MCHTPNIDDLARRGCTFLRHYTAAAPCGPARASLLTGLYAQTHHVTSNHSPLNGQITNIARLLAEGGIGSHLVGYTDTVTSGGRRGGSLNGGRRPVMPGFSVHTYFNLDPGGLAEWIKFLEKRGHGPFQKAMDAFAPVEPDSYIASFDVDESDTAFIADRTIDCIQRHSGERWLIHATFLRPHPPWVAARSYVTLYSPEQMRPPIQGSCDTQHPFTRFWCQHRSDTANPLRVRAIYAALVTDLDFQIGRILEYLRRAGLLDQTLVILTSDHGDMLGDHGLTGTGGFHDPAYKIPLIIADPLSAAGGRRLDEFTESVDILPTVLDWLRQPAASPCDGLSLLPLMADCGLPWPRRAAYWEFYFHFAAQAIGAPVARCCLSVWRTSTEKYVHFNGFAPLLFDLRRDPCERINRAADSAYRQRGSNLRRQLREHRIRHTHLASA